MVDSYPDKASLRHLARDLRKKHVNDAPVSFLDSVCAYPQFRKANTVAAYMPLFGEPDIADVINHCFSERKRVLIPAWDSDSGAYRFTQILPDTKFLKGKRDIPEPIEKIWVNADEIDCFLVPGLLFDKHGMRLGHGAGYYDRGGNRVHRHWAGIPAPGQHPISPRDRARRWQRL